MVKKYYSLKLSFTKGKISLVDNANNLVKHFNP